MVVKVIGGILRTTYKEAGDLENVSGFLKGLQRPKRFLGQEVKSKMFLKTL